MTNDVEQKLFPLLPGNFLLVTDGSRIYFFRTNGGSVGLVQVSALGGETVPVYPKNPTEG
jgi:hypothetical protein